MALILGQCEVNCKTLNVKAGSLANKYDPRDWIIDRSTAESMEPL